MSEATGPACAEAAHRTLPHMKRAMGAGRGRGGPCVGRPGNGGRGPGKQVPAANGRVTGRVNVAPGGSGDSP